MRWRWMMTATLSVVLAGPATAHPAPRWVPAWIASATPDRLDGGADTPLQFADETVRQDMRLGSAAVALRVRISNELGTAPLTIAAGTARLLGGGGGAQPLRFDGRASVTVPPGGVLLSDPVPLRAPALGEVAVSLYFPRRRARRYAARPCGWSRARPRCRTARRWHIARTSSPPFTCKRRTHARPWWWRWAIRSPKAPPPHAAPMAIGRPCWPGGWSSVAPAAWWCSTPASAATSCSTTTAAPALARLDRDVLALPGVDQVILFEGINDIRHGGPPDAIAGRNAADMVLGYRQIVTRLQQHGIAVIGATLTPFGNSDRYEPVAAATRQTLNGFIRDGQAFDAVIDFDAALRDPARPEWLPAALTRDFLHPNDAGYQRMAESVDLSLFCKAR